MTGAPTGSPHSMGELPHPIVSCHEHPLHHGAGEDAVLDDARDGVEGSAEHDRVGDRVEPGIHDQIAVVGPSLADVDRLCAEVVHTGRNDAGGEVEHLEWCAERSETLDELGLVDDHDEAGTHLGDELLSRVSTASTLGEVEVGVDLVGAVDGDVERADVVGRGDLDPERHGELFGPNRGSGADDVEVLLAERADRVIDGRAGAESYAHTGLHQLSRLSPGRLLRFVLGHRHGSQRIAGLMTAVTVLALSVSVLVTAVPAGAHGGDPFVHAEVTDVGIDGLSVGVVPGEIAQVVMVNETGGVVEVLDDDGTPFVRFGPTSVEVDVASPAWLRTLDPAGGDRHGVPSGCGGQCWRTVADSPVFAWSDHRLHPAVRDVPQDLFGSSSEVVLAEWVIPLRADGEPGDVAGEIVYRPAEGFALAGLASGPPPEGVAVAIEPGSVPTIDVEPTGDLVFIRDAAGDAFVLIGGGEVSFQTGTRVWHDLAGLAGLDVSTDPPVSGGDLVVVATGERFAWLDPRGAYLDDSGPEEVAVVDEWTISYLTSAGDDEIAGQTQWIPTPDRAPTAGGAGIPVWALVGAAGATGVVVVVLLRRRRVPAE